jgi:hypothetical protein
MTGATIGVIATFCNCRLLIGSTTRTKETLA